MVPVQASPCLQLEYVWVPGRSLGLSSGTAAVLHDFIECCVLLLLAVKFVTEGLAAHCLDSFWSSSVNQRPQFAAPSASVRVVCLAAVAVAALFDYISRSSVGL